ncbi:serine acetyltransferase [Clostridium perfringens]|nr:serine acetyltransferase [Clostridium perfringens]
MVYKLYKISHKLYIKNVPIIPLIIKGIIRVFFAAAIPYEAEIGENTLLGYSGLGIVIHKNAVIGKNCVISQNVTIGGTQGQKNVPVIEDNVEIGAGANIIGNVRIGSGAVIGAGAVVISDIPKNAIAVGVPAIVKKINQV